MSFRKYMHVERLGTSETEGIELGDCYVFPKLDGSNGCVFYDEETKQVLTASRKRVLSLDADNQGFCEYVLSDKNLSLYNLVNDNKHLIVYVEWLVPHSLKTYRDDAWRKPYVIDIYDTIVDEYVSYNIYKPLLEKHNIDYIPAQSIIRNGTKEVFGRELGNNNFLIKEGAGCGEGIVIKRYGYKNKYGHTTWAKIASNEFKTKHQKAMGPTVKSFSESVELKIAEKYVTLSLVEKTIAKIKNDSDGWSSKSIPRLLNTVYHDVITEEMWDILKVYKSPKIDFKQLNRFVTAQIKTLVPEVF